MRLTIGIDPDSDKHGIAVFHGSELAQLATMRCVDVVSFVTNAIADGHDVMASCEDVMANQFVYGRNMRSSKSAQSKVAMHIGRCQQAQVELVRWLEHLEVTVRLYAPTRGNWANDPAMFQRITGWQGRSNADTRSAAFFGWLVARN